MPIASARTADTHPRRLPAWLGLCFFLAIAVFFLWEEHRAHLLGAVPYVLVLLCPTIHLFMHRGHGDHAGHPGHVARRHAADEETRS